MKVRIFAAFALVTCSCALWSRSGPTPEEVAKSATELLDSAEKSLESLEPEQAEALLSKAKEELVRPELAESELRPPLEARRAELSDRVSGVKVLALKKRLETAKSALASAMEKARSGAAEIDAKQPPEAAFDRAREGIVEANAALESGARLEPHDPEYGKTAADARAELKTIEEKVEAKWAVVEIAVRRASLLEKTKAVDDAIRSGDVERASSSSKVLSEALAKASALEAKDKTYARAAAGAKDALVRADVFAHRAQIEAADREAIAVLNALVDRTQMDAAEKAIAALEKAIASAPESAKTDRRHAAFTAQMTKKVERYRAGVEAKRIELDASEHKAKVDAAVADVNAQIEGLIDETAARYDKADAAVTDLAELISSAAELRTKNRGHDRYLASIERTLDGLRREIRKRRIEKTDELVVKKIAELSTEASFADAEKALSLLQSTVESNAELLSKEPAYARSIAAAKQRIAAHRAAIDARALQIEVERGRKAIEAALAMVDEKMAAAVEKEADFVEAEQAISDLEADVERASSTKDRAFASYLAELRRRIPAQRAELERRRIAVEVAALEKPASEAERALDERMQALAGLPEDARFDEAEAAAEALLRAAEKESPFAEKDRAHVARFAALRKKAESSRQAIERRRGEVLVQRSKNAIDEAARALDESLKGADLDAIGAAIDALEGAVQAGAEAAAKDRTLANVSAFVAKRIARERVALEAKRTATAIAAHREEIDRAAQDLKEKIEALTDLESSRYRAAEEAGLALQKIVDANGELAEKDRRHASYLAGMRAFLGKQRLEIEKRRIDAAEANALAALAKLKDGSQQQVIEAEVAMELFADTTGSKKSLLEKDPVYARRVKAAEVKVQQIRAAIDAKKNELEIAEHRGKVDARLAAAKEKVAALDAKPDYAAAEAAVKALEEEIERGAELVKKDRRYGSVLASLGKEAAAARAAIARKQDEALVAKHRARVDEALANVEAKLATLTDLTAQRYDAAVDLITKLGKVIDEGEEARSKDRAHARYLAALAARIPSLYNEVRKRRIDATDAAVEKAIAGLGEKPSDAEFSEVEKLIRLLESTTLSNKEFLQRDKVYAKHIAQAMQRLAAHQAAFAKKRVDVDVAEHRAEVDPLEKAAIERLNALSGASQDADFARALDALTKLEEAIEHGTERARNDRAHAGYLGKLRLQVPVWKKAVEKQRIDVALAQHRARADAAAAELDTALAALAGEPEEAAFDVAARAVEALQQAIAGGGPTDPKHEQHLAALSKKAALATGTIERRRIEVEVLAHRARLDELADRVKVEIDRMSGEEKTGADAALAAVDALESAAVEGEKLAAKDKKYAAYLLGVQKAIPSRRAAIERKKNEALIRAHEEEVARAEKSAREKIDALGGVENAAYQSAFEAVAQLRRVLARAAELREKDRAHANRMKSIEQKLAGWELEIRKRRLDAHDALVAEKIGSLEGEPEEGDFEAAESALRAYQGALESNRAQLAADKYYAKQAARAADRIAAFGRAIEGRRAELARRAYRARVDAALEKVEGALASDTDPGKAEDANAELETLLEEPALDQKHAALAAKRAANARRTIAARKLRNAVVSHRATVETAAAKLEEALAALDGGDPTSADAEEALQTLVFSLDAAGEAAKDREHAKYLAAIRKRADAAGPAIRQKRAEAESAKHRVKVDEAVGEVRKRIDALRSLEPRLYRAAEEAVTALEEVIEEGAELARRDPKYAKLLALVRDGVEGHRRAIEKRRIEVAREAAERALAAAQEEPDGGKLAAVERALGDLDEAIDAGQRTKPEAERKKAARLKAQLEAVRFEMEVRPHRERVESLKAAAEAKIAELGGAETFAPAEEAIAELSTALKDGEKYGDRNRAYAKKLASVRGAVARWEKRIARAKIDLANAAKKEKVEAAVVEVSESMRAIEGATDPAVFEAADRALAELSSAIDEARSIPDKRFAKRIAAMKRALPDQQRAVMQARVEGALRAAEEKIAALSEPDQAAFEAAEAAASAAKAEVDKARATKPKAKKEKRWLDTVAKRASSLSKRIEAKRIALVAQLHRAKVESALADVTQAIETLSAGPGAIQVAQDAIELLENELSKGDEAAKQSRAHAKYLASVRKKIPSFHAAIERAKVADDIAAHKGKVEAEHAEIARAVASLTDESSPYQAVEDRIWSLKKTIAGGAEYAAIDPQHAAYLTKIERQLPEHQRELRLRQLSAKEVVAARAIEALAERPAEEAFTAAENAVANYESTQKSAREFKQKDKPYERALAEAAKKSKAFRSRIARVRQELEIETHRSRVEAAAADLSTKMESLEGDAAIKEAEDALKSLTDEVASGAALAKRSKAYQKYLAEKRREASSYAERLESVRFAREFGPQQAKVEEAKSALAEKLRALESEPSEESIQAADAAADELSVAIADGVSHASRNARYERFHRAAKKSLARARTTIAGAKVSLGRAGYRAELDEKTAAVKERIGALNDRADQDAFDAASAAVDELSQVIDQGAPYAKKDKKLKRDLLAKKKALPRHRTTILSKKIDALLAKARAKAEEGNAELVAQAITDLNQAIADGKDLAKKNKKLKKQMLAAKREGTKLRSRATKNARDSVYAEHRARVEAAKAKVAEAEDAEAESQAIGELLSVIADGKPLAKKNKRHKKYLDAVARQARKQRAQLADRAMEAEVGEHRTEVKAASAELEKAMKAIRKRATRAKVERAAEAADRLETLIAEGAPLGRKYAKYRKYLAARAKRLALHKKTIAKKTKRKSRGGPHAVLRIEVPTSWQSAAPA